jgi:hypothetical protein
MKTSFPISRPQVLLGCALLPVLAASCAPHAWRHKDQSVTVAKRSLGGPASRYWLVGAKPGTVNSAENVSIYSKPQGGEAVPVKCSGFIDTTRPKRIEVRLAEKHGSHWEQAGVNGSYKLADENSPRPFYHWLIP